MNIQVLESRLFLTKSHKDNSYIWLDERTACSLGRAWFSTSTSIFKLKNHANAKSCFTSTTPGLYILITVIQEVQDFKAYVQIVTLHTIRKKIKLGTQLWHNFKNMLLITFWSKMNGHWCLAWMKTAIPFKHFFPLCLFFSLSSGERSHLGAKRPLTQLLPF